MAIFKVFWKAVALFLALAIFLYLIAVAINWRDQPPSADYLRLVRLVEARPAVDDADNAFVYLLGMAASPDELPGGVGAQRAAWLEAVNRDFGRINDDPLHTPYDLVAGRSAGVKSLFDACTQQLGRRCRVAFDQVPAVEAWSDADRLLLARYRELSARPAWREVVPHDARAPIAAYQHAIGGLRLQMLSLRGGDAATLRAALAQDERFWRRMLSSSNILISKMIAVAGLRQHYYFGNLLLRGIPAARAADALPAEWREALTRPELSLERAMAGELVFNESVVREPGDIDVLEEEPDIDPYQQRGRAWRRVRSATMRPFYQPQDVLNHFAADYTAADKAFDVPLEQFPAAARAWTARPVDDAFLSRIYDATGDYIRGLFAINFSQYRLRVASLEGARRAVLLTTELRARGVKPPDVAAELGKSSLRNPFGGAFGWNAEEQAVVYIGPEALQWRRLMLAY